MMNQELQIKTLKDLQVATGMKLQPKLAKNTSVQQIL